MEYRIKGEYVNGFACVQRADYLWNFINERGEILSPNLWFSITGDFIDGFACVQRGNGKWNYWLYSICY